MYSDAVFICYILCLSRGNPRPFFLLLSSIYINCVSSYFFRCYDRFSDINSNTSPCGTKLAQWCVKTITVEPLLCRLLTITPLSDQLPLTKKKWTFPKRRICLLNGIIVGYRRIPLSQIWTKCSRCIAYCNVGLYSTLWWNDFVPVASMILIYMTNYEFQKSPFRYQTILHLIY